MLVEGTDPETGTGLTGKQVRDETISFFIAGHATIASALTWTWYLLSTHPAAWRTPPWSCRRRCACTRPST